jgi:hypothetical protein
MGKKERLRWLHFLPVFLLLVLPLHVFARQNADETPTAQVPAEPSSPSAPPADQGQPKDGEPKGDQPKDDSGSGGKPAAQQSPKKKAPDAAEKEETNSGPVSLSYSLTNAYSVTLPLDWAANTKSEIPPPAPLSPYAPPFHLSGNLVLENRQRGGILQFASSDNPFIGHDAYWLDTQMHSPTGSGMSLLDFFFYYFFPPSDACMHQVLTTYAPASRVSPDTSDSPGYLQVYYSCPLSDTLSDFYSTQISAGITFQHTDNGTRVLAPIGDFYVAPMEQFESSGITFFVFEAQGMNSVTSDAARRCHLPANSQGGQPDFFWAIACTSPFPFVADSGRKDATILHVAYARLGVDADARAEFMNILSEIRTH